MNAKFELQELEAIPQNTLVDAFETETGIKAIVENIKAQARNQVTNVVWDLSKKKDRDAIASLARKVASSKTAIDAAGKQLKERYTVITNKIDADRKYAREELDPVRDEIRKPLTDWEGAKKAREAEIQRKIADFDKGRVDESSSVALIKSVISEIESIVIDDSFEDFQDVAKLRKYECLEHMQAVLVAREKYEAEQAELEAMRLAEQQRLQREHDERIAREATEKAQREAEEKARLEAERVEREKHEAEQREARLKAEKEAAVLREQQLKIQAEQQAKQAEIDKQKAIEAERIRIEQQQLAQAEAERKAQEAREADKAHKKKICAEALKGLTDLGISPERGKDILNAINKGLVPHVSIKF